MWFYYKSLKETFVNVWPFSVVVMVTTLYSNGPRFDPGFEFKFIIFKNNYFDYKSLKETFTTVWPFSVVVMAATMSSKGSRFDFWLWIWI